MPELGIIRAATLASSHVFSFASQPNLKSLFEVVCNPGGSLLIVVGAGLSVNAGLPSWGSLLKRIAEGINDDDLVAQANASTQDSARRAELYLQLARRSHPNREEHEPVRDALFPVEAPAAPGPLAHSLARLIIARMEKKLPTRVITTNYDVLLEEALETLLGEGNVPAFGLDQFGEWAAHCDSGALGVLHVHGILRHGRADDDDEPENDPVVKPIILTETSFLKYGAQVRKVVGDMVRAHPSLFVGLSMTDPNLVGPLYEAQLTKRGAKLPPRFAASVVVMPSQPVEQRELVARFAVESSTFLIKRLSLAPVLLKSYSQLDQLVCELGLAVAAEKNYERVPAGTTPRARADRTRRTEATTLYYGPRSQRAIRSCYAALGLNSPTYEPQDSAAAAAISDHLNDIFTAPGGLQEKLNSLSHLYAHDNPGRRPEQFGLNLWLRVLDEERGNKPTYALKLVGASAFYPRNAWFQRRSVEIESDSPYPAAQAAFLGVDLRVNLDPGNNAGVWRGAWAAPFVLQGASSTAMVGKRERKEMLDRVTVGVLTLDSNYPVTAQTFTGEEKDLGVLGRLDAPDFKQVRDLLLKTPAQLLVSAPGGRPTSPRPARKAVPQKRTQKRITAPRR